MYAITLTCRTLSPCYKPLFRCVKHLLFFVFHPLNHSQKVKLLLYPKGYPSPIPKCILLSYEAQAHPCCQLNTNLHCKKSNKKFTSCWPCNCLYSASIQMLESPHNHLRCLCCGGCGAAELRKT